MLPVSAKRCWLTLDQVRVRDLGCFCFGQMVEWCRIFIITLQPCSFAGALLERWTT